MPNLPRLNSTWEDKILAQAGTRSAWPNRISSLLPKQRIMDVMEEILLDDNIEINTQDNYGNTLLMIMIKEELPKEWVQKKIIETDADFDIQNNFGNNALFIAAGQHNLELTKLLLDKGAKINVANKFGDTVLLDVVQNFRMLKANFRNPEIVKLLLDHNAEITPKSSFKVLEIASWDQKIFQDDFFEVMYRKYGALGFVEYNMLPNAHETIINIIGYDHNGAFERQGRDIQSIAMNKKANFININLNIPLVNKDSIKEVVKTLGIEESKITLIIGLHGSGIPIDAGSLGLDIVSQKTLEILSTILLALLGAEETHLITINNSDNIRESSKLTNMFFRDIAEIFNKPIEVIFDSCYGAIARKAALENLPKGSKFISLSDQRHNGGHIFETFLVMTQEDGSLSVTDIPEFAACHRPLEITSRQDQNKTTYGLVYSDKQILLYDELLKFAGSPAINEMRILIHDRLEKANPNCRRHYHQIDDAIDKMMAENIDINSTHYPTMLAVTKVLYDLHFEPTQCLALNHPPSCPNLMWETF